MTALRPIGGAVLLVLLAAGPVDAQQSKQPLPEQINPPLKEVPIDLDLSDAARKVDPFLFVEPPETYSDEKIVVVMGLLRRELYRQAFLIAGRDELGLTVRDGTLGELPVDELPPSTHRFRVVPQFVMNKPHETAVQIGPVAASRTIWRAAADSLPVANHMPAAAVTAAEEYSRTGYVTALKRGGHRGKPNPVDAKAVVPAEVEPLLVQMTMTAQFAAVRALHATLRAKGESPGTLGALSRAYANLGMLTDTQWGAAPWVFKARGLLYAERLRHREPASPWGLWNRGYAAALAGMHAEALNDFKAADAARGATPVPEWVVLADALCRFDTRQLKTAAGKDGAFADTAAVFEFLTAENINSPNQALEVGLRVVKKIPECYRVHDALAETGGVAALHRTTLVGLQVMSQTIMPRIAAMSGIPKTVADAIQANASEPEVVKALLETGRLRDDRTEPSWAALGQLVRETRVPQVVHRLDFMRNVWSVDPTEFLDEVKPLVADHPLYPYLDTFRLDRQRDKIKIQQIVRSLKVPELTYRHRGLLNEFQLLGGVERTKYSNIALMHGDNLFYDGYLSIRNFTPQQAAAVTFAKRLLVHSPFAPIARAAIISHDWPSAKDQAAQWEKEAQQPNVILALARQALAENRMDDAERIISKAIEMSPDMTTYRLLADAYKKKGNMDKWVATLERYLKEPDPGLGHARVRVDIADYFIAKKDFTKAKPYADEAAETYAAWAMMCASKCEEGLLNWEAAEKWMQRVSERYDSTPHIWYFWCCRNDRGDRDASRVQLDAHMKKIGKPRTALDHMIAGFLDAADGQPIKAGDRFMAANRVGASDVYVMSAVVLFDAAGDAERRDQALARISAKGPYEPFVALLRSTIAKGPKEVPTADQIAEAMKQIGAGPVIDCHYYLGRFLLTRGQKDQAAEEFKKCTTNLYSFSLTSPLAGLAVKQIEKK